MMNLDALRRNLDQFEKISKEMEVIFQKAYLINPVTYPHYDILLRIKADAWQIEEPKIVRKTSFRASMPRQKDPSAHEKMQAIGLVSHVNSRFQDIERRLEKTLFSIVKDISHPDWRDIDVDGYIEIHVVVGKTTRICAGYGQTIQSIHLQPQYHGLTPDCKTALIDLFLALRYAPKNAQKKSKPLWTLVIKGEYFEEYKNCQSIISINPQIHADTEKEAMLLCAASGYNFVLSPRRVSDIKIMKQISFKSWENGAFDLSDEAHQDIINPIKGIS